MIYLGADDYWERPGSVYCYTSSVNQGAVYVWYLRNLYTTYKTVVEPVNFDNDDCYSDQTADKTFLCSLQ